MAHPIAASGTEQGGLRQGEADRAVQAYLEQLAAAGVPPMETLSPAAARQLLADAQAAADVDISGVEVAEKSIEADGESISLTVVRPAGVKQTPPAFMFFHGGGWVLGDFPTHQRLVRDLVVESGAAAVFVNYTPSPEARFPLAIEQAYAATRWVAEHSAQLNLDGSRLAVAGNSVGGNMATVVALLAKDRGGPHIKFQLLLWPVTDASFETASYRQFSEGYALTTNMMRWFWEHYTTDVGQRRTIYASPLQASLEELRGLPPALIQTAQLDVLRDEGEAYARKLNAAGVDVTSVRYNGLIHDYGLLNALATAPAVRAAVAQAGRALARNL
ncbi:MAG: alpha/beta hydrolase [Pirellulales bacterium]